MMPVTRTLASLALARSAPAAACGTRRCIAGGVDHDQAEPAATPWVKVLERPGDDAGNRSEDNPAQNPYKDTSGGEPLPVEQAPIDPEALEAAAANPSVDSVRHLAGKLNEAVGGEYDFPQTGGSTMRDMAAEIGTSIGHKLGVHQDEQGGGVSSKADDAVEAAADRVADAYGAAKAAVKGAVTGSGGSDGSDSTGSGGSS